MALIACQCSADLRGIVDSLLCDAGSWPDKIVHEVIDDLFPAIISVDELIILVRRAGQTFKGPNTLSWAMGRIAETVDIASEKGIGLCLAIAELIYSARAADLDAWQMESEFSWLTPTLAILCRRYLAAEGGHEPQRVIRAAIIAVHFDEKHGYDQSAMAELRKQFVDPTLRGLAFWIDLDFMDALVPANNDWVRFSHITNYGLIGTLIDLDFQWLIAALADQSHVTLRGVALEGLLFLWRQRGKLPSDVEQIRLAINGDGGLEATLAGNIAPPKANADAEQLKAEHETSKARWAAKEKNRLKDWQAWRQELLADPESAFADGNVASTIDDIYLWMKARKRGNALTPLWDREAIATVFGQKVADLAEAAFKNCWRQYGVVLWSQRAASERNGIPWGGLYGACGLAIDAAQRSRAKIT